MGGETRCQRKTRLARQKTLMVPIQVREEVKARPQARVPVARLEGAKVNVNRERDRMRKTTVEPASKKTVRSSQEIEEERRLAQQAKEKEARKRKKKPSKGKKKQPTKKKGAK